jgi:two-component system chemotaxis response regulator CheB
VTAAGPIRVLVVEDSLTVRRRICEVIEADPGFEVIGEAGDGERAVELCAALRPDAITMDMMLPLMTGLEATEQIMAHCATPILIVSASTNRGELFKTYDALAAGAVDVLEKPTGEEPEGVWEEKLLSAIRTVSRIRVITHLRGRARGQSTAPAMYRSPTPVQGPRRVELVTIGASTGGPGAVVTVLRGLPRLFEIPILLVVHIGERFGVALAEWVSEQAGRPVSYGEAGASIAAATGHVIMAPPGVHLAVRGRRVHLTREPERHSCRPSVDVLFESAAAEYGSSLAACLLTGMGRDGAAGLLQARRAGGLTIGQDEATSVIYGMPREAALLGAVEHVLPLDEIGPYLGRHAGLPRRVS